MSVNKRLKHLRRPKKKPAEKRRRQATQRQRLVSLGLSEDEVSKLDAKEVRQLLRHPAKLVVCEDVEKTA